MIVLSGLALVLPVIGWLALAHALGRPAINQINSHQRLAPIQHRPVPQLPVAVLSAEAAVPDDVPHDPAAARLRHLGASGDRRVRLAVGRAAALGLPGRRRVAGGPADRRCRGGGAPVRHRRQLALLGFYALTLIALLGLLHITDYRSIIAGQGPILQGRYLLPAVGLLGLAAGAVVVWMPTRWRPSACGLALTGLLVLQTISLATVAPGVLPVSAADGIVRRRTRTRTWLAFAVSALVAAIVLAVLGCGR